MVQTLERLRHRVEAAPDSKSRFYALTRLGIELAQLGRTDDARLVLHDLRLSDTTQAAELLAIYPVLIDGICSYYEGQSTHSVDRLARAHALACATQDRRLIGESGVWLALAAYSFDKLDLLDRSLLRAGTCADAIEKNTLARLLAIVADLWQLAGSPSSAMRLYSAARQLARVEQDDAVLVAIEFNRLAAGLTRLKFDEFLELDSRSAELRQWDIEMASVEALHKVYRNDSLGHLLVLCNARRKYFAGDYSGAVSLFVGLHRERLWPDVGLGEQALIAEIAWCRVLAGELHVVSEVDFPSLDEILERDTAAKIDCLYYAAKIGSRFSYAIDIDLVRSALVDSRAELLGQLEYFGELASRIVSSQQFDAALAGLNQSS